MYKKNIMVKNFNRGEIMKKTVMYSIYSVCLIVMIGVLVAYNNMNSDVDIPSTSVMTDYDYVIDLFDHNLQQVNKEGKTTLIRPYSSNGVKIVKNFYDYKGEEKEQQKSIIYYEGTYMQSTGISYSADGSFDVLAVLPGEVTEVLKDELVGNSVTIKHDDNTYSVYQSITDITIQKGDHVEQGDKIAVTGTSNISKDLNNHLYFELIVNGVSVNPEEYYDAEL